METTSLEMPAVINDWTAFYWRRLGKNQDFSGIYIPRPQSRFTQFLAMAPGITLMDAYRSCERSFPCRLSPIIAPNGTLDGIDIAHTRDPGDALYGAWVEPRVEPNPALCNHTANYYWMRELAGMTLQEYFIHRLKYWDVTGQHLDNVCMTMCCGSTVIYDDTPHVPVVYTRDGLMFVDLFQDDLAGPRLGPRRVIC